MEEIVASLNIKIGIITTPPEVVSEIATRLANAGIKGILNFTPKPLSRQESVYLEEYDMITSLEKVAYFVKPAD
jgi:redox-sensing transcriptional repressor